MITVFFPYSYVNVYLIQAFGLHAQTDYLQRAWMIIGGIYLFFVVDKLLNLVVLVRDVSILKEGDFLILSFHFQRHKLRASVHPTAISKNNNGTPRSSQSSVTPSNVSTDPSLCHSSSLCQESKNISMAPFRSLSLQSCMDYNR